MLFEHPFPWSRSCNSSAEMIPFQLLGNLPLFVRIYKLDSIDWVGNIVLYCLLVVVDASIYLCIIPPEMYWCLVSNHFVDSRGLFIFGHDLFTCHDGYHIIPSLIVVFSVIIFIFFFCRFATRKSFLTQLTWMEFWQKVPRKLQI